MTEPNNSQHEPRHAADGTLDGSESNPEAVETHETQDNGQVDLETVLADLAEARENAEQSKTRGDTYFEALKLATMQQAAGDVLQALDSMPDDDPRYYTDAGFPSLEGMREVATELVSERPHLAKANGNIRQGVQSQQTAVPDWSDILRGVFANA